MPLLDILLYPDPRLRKQAKPVKQVTEDIRQLIDDMAETMYAAPGIGLAATQVNVHQRILVIDISEERNDLRVFINPIIDSGQGEAETEEGCLSLPGIRAPVIRLESITLSAKDRLGEDFTLVTDGLLAICIQHEIDHLNGKVMVDYLSRLKHDRIRKRLLKEQHEQTVLHTGASII
ncbi:MAG TPA: peptide deformylase [Gammaproteobacteria bacterium]|nr:peptide deformylase [Gammaproteobacteria bacterium]HIL19020.1 peptide deformylase [Gammaproteobacteria bacterium]